MENLSSAKKSLRQFYKNKRALISQNRRDRAAQALALFIKQEHVTTQKYILSFKSISHEIDTAEINKNLMVAKKLALPQIIPDTKELLPVSINDNLQYEQFTDLLINHNNVITDWNQIGIILVPGLAFDETSKHRLGYGQGYYDRFLKKTASYQIRTIGISFLEQKSLSLPVETHDFPLSEVLFI